MRIEELIQGIATEKVTGGVTADVLGIHFDSRKIEKNHLFVAVRGTATDGHHFIQSALEKGAKAVVCEELPDKIEDDVCYIQVKDSAEALGYIINRWFDFPSKKLKLVGVTGTNGKTTIATLLYRLFKKMGYKAGLISTVCNYVGDEKLETTHTTPDAITLNHLLNQMVESNCEYVFMEVSSHAVEQKRVTGLEFAGGVFTNLTRDHIDYHQTFENYLKAKKRFFDGLGREAFALTNVDDRNGLIMLQNTSANKKTYSIRSMADFKTKIIADSFEGMELLMNEKELHTPFIGRFNASNLSAVFGAAVLLEQEPDEVLRVISMLYPVDGRFETLRSPSGYTAIVDYAHTPDALTNVISTINEILQRGNRLITVVGCGGNRDKGKRPMMAKEAVNGSWKAILTSDNPRDEEPMAIINDMLDGLTPEQKSASLTIVDRREAIKTACSLAQPGDVVLVAGKGHEDYQIVKGVKHHFDDREEVEKCF